MLGGRKRYILSISGHIQALVNPPSAESRASYRVTEGLAVEPAAWAAQADVRRGSWWPEYGEWLPERAGELGPAPSTLGSRRHTASAGWDGPSPRPEAGLSSRGCCPTQSCTAWASRAAMAARSCSCRDFSSAIRR